MSYTLSKMTIMELKRVCKQINLNHLGTKDEIISRLLGHDDWHEVLICINDIEVEKSLLSISI
jgi:hypothetical protein